MKLLIFSALIIAASAGSPNSTLSVDIKAIYDVIPWVKLQSLSKFYLHFDDDYNELAKLLLSRPTQQLFFKIQSTKQWQDFYQYVKCAGLDLLPLLVTLEDTLIPGNSIPDCVHVEAGGFEAFYLRFLDIFPLKQFEFQVKLKVKTSPDFKKFYNKVSSVKASSRFRVLLNTDVVAEVIGMLKKYGITKEIIDETVSLFFNWD